MKNFFYLLLFVCINPHLIAQTYDTLALKVGEVYNFEVGDEFHRRYLHESNLLGGYTYYEQYIITKILTQNYTADSSSMSYTAQVTNYEPNICGGTIEIDTLGETIINLGAYIITVTDSTDTDGDPEYGYNRHVVYAADSTIYNGLRVNSLSIGNTYFDTGNGSSVGYIEGCGSISYVWEVDATFFDRTEVSLVYFKKGVQEWGIPVQLPALVQPNSPEISMTIGEAYDFDIGDEFQFVKNTSHAGNLLGQYFTKRIVTNKLPDLANNTMQYTYIDSVKYIATAGGFSNYTLQHTQNIEYLDTLVFNFDEVLDSVYWYKQGCHNITDVLLDSCVLLSNTIQLIAHEISYPIWHKFNFIKGCGMYYQTQYQADMSNENLVYYHKINGTSCGTPTPYFTGLEDTHPQVLQLSISPNPANNHVQIGLPATANHQNATLQITDLQGRVVKTITYTTASFGGGKGEASTHDLPNGMYLVSYTQQGLLLGRAKMVVQH